MQYTLTIKSSEGAISTGTENGETLLEVLRRAGHAPASPCGGRGVCGKCTVSCGGLLSSPSSRETEFLGKDGLESGLRLACLTKITGDAWVNSPCSPELDVCTDFTMGAIESAPMFLKYGVAVDIGTTTVCAQLFDVSGSLATAVMANPQSVYGADVISRIGAAIGGSADQLQKLICDGITVLMQELAGKAGIGFDEIDTVVLTGNTAMLYLLTKTDTEPLSHAPFEAPELFGRYVEPEMVRMPSSIKVFLPSCISAFVGADISCAILATGLTELSGSAVMADIGTNGEIALWKNGELSCCSTAAGPAFEGAGITCGSNAVPGAIDTVDYKENTLQCTTIGGKKPIGICGSGIIDATAAVLDAGIMDNYGLLDDETDKASWLEDKDGLLLCGDVYITQKDIRMVQLAKSAVCAGMQTLMIRKNCPDSEVSTLYVAGGFGKHIRFDKAARIGLIPPALSDKAVAVGNAALAGAAMILCSYPLAEKTRKLAESAETVDLSIDPVFMDSYTTGMMFGED